MEIFVTKNLTPPDWNPCHSAQRSHTTSTDLCKLNHVSRSIATMDPSCKYHALSPHETDDWHFFLQ